MSDAFAGENLAICGGDGITVSGFSLRKFGKGLTKAVKGAAKVATAVTKVAAKVVDKIPLANDARKLAVKGVMRAVKIAAVVSKAPWKIAMAPSTLARKALGSALKAAGLGKVNAILDAPEKLGKMVNSATGNAAQFMLRGNPAGALKALKVGAAQLKADPAFNVGMTGLSFVPGMGQVSSGIALAVNLGAGASLKDAALAGALQACPGGPAVKAALACGIGLAKGKRLSEAAIMAARESLPGGAAGKAAFDAGLLLARRKASPSALIGIARESLPGDSKKVFDTAWRGAQVAQQATGTARNVQRQVRSLL